MPLTENQQLLLQGEIDGHLTPGDQRQAQALLCDKALGAEAAAYVAGLQKLRALVQQHGQVKVSPMLGSRLLAALEGNFDDVSRPVQNKAVHKLPTVRWNTMLMAAAAALVVSLGLIVGPGLWQSSPATPTQTGSSVNAPSADTQKTGNTNPTVEAITAPTGQPDRGNTAHDEYTGKLDTGRLDPSQPGKPEDSRKDPGALKGGGGGGRNDDPDDLRRNGPRSGLGSMPPARKHEGVYVLRLDRGVDTSMQLGFEVNRERGASNLQLSTDILTVASMYGDARMLTSATPGAHGRDKQEGTQDAESANDFTQFDAVEVEVEEAGLVGLLSAMERLGAAQNYGVLNVPEDLAGATNRESQVAGEIAALSRAATAPPAENADAKWQAFLPRGVQLAELRRRAKLGELDERRLADLEHTPGDTHPAKEENVADSANSARNSDLGSSRKLRLVIKLQ